MQIAKRRRDKRRQEERKKVNKIQTGRKEGERVWRGFNSPLTSLTESKL